MDYGSFLEFDYYCDFGSGWYTFVMKLTVFLVTKGREKFLGQILDSFEKLFMLDVNFLILDNGAPDSVSAKLKTWQIKNPNRIKIVRFEDNESRPSVYWEVLKENNVDWVVCPSDDDEMRFEIVEEWNSALDQNPDMVGFAASAALMDESGKLTGEVIAPSATRYQSAIEQIAAGFYEPPFHWPCLFIKTSSLPSVTPPSRYAFDWWIGLNLLIVGKVVTTNSVGLNYRVHPQQESFLAPLRRKYFEAHIWINELVNSDVFFKWAQSLSDSERVQFWDQVTKSLPIYGDSEFSRPIMNSIYVCLIKTSDQVQTANYIANRYALSSGVLLKNGEVKNLISKIPSLRTNMEGNISVIPATKACSAIRLACEEIQSKSAIDQYLVSCVHGEKSASAININCLGLNENLKEVNADLIVSQITEYLEINGKFDLIITGGEKMLVHAFRKWKNRMPKSLRIYLRALKSRN